jgi:hypothetical protein
MLKRKILLEINRIKGLMFINEQGETPSNQGTRIVPGYKLNIVTNDNILKNWKNIPDNFLSEFGEKVLNMSSLTDNGKEEARKVYFDLMDAIAKRTTERKDLMSPQLLTIAFNEVINNNSKQNDFRGKMKQIKDNPTRMKGASDWFANHLINRYDSLGNQTT